MVNLWRQASGVLSPLRRQAGRIVRVLWALLLAVALGAAAFALDQRRRVVPVTAAAVPFSGTASIVSVDDGDSFVAELPGRGRVHVRLHAVDAPELLQSHGLAARSALLEILAAGALRVDCYKADPRGRAVCRASVAASAGNRDVGLALLERGMAWHFKAFADELSAAERRAAQAAEAQARAARRGLWAAADPMPPWTCRARLRNGETCS